MHASIDLTMPRPVKLLPTASKQLQSRQRLQPKGNVAVSVGHVCVRVRSEGEPAAGEELSVTVSPTERGVA